MISFVIPCFEQGRFLSRAVSSALNQANVELEVIVVDDGSHDNPLEHLGSLADDARVRCIRQENAGLPAARNRGIRESRGAYLNFLDADDWLDERFGAELYAALQASPGLGFAYSDLQHIVEGAPIADSGPAESGAGREDYSVGAVRKITSGDIFSSLLQGGYFTPNCVLVPRSVIDEVGCFDDSLGGNADWELWLRIAASGRHAFYVDKRLAFYRLHGKNMSLNRDHMVATRAAALRKLIPLYPDRFAQAILDMSQRFDEEAARNRSLFTEQTDWIAQLKQAQEWQVRQSLEQSQRIVALEAENARLEQHSIDQQRWAAQLEEAKAWQERQSLILKEWIVKLEAADTEFQKQLTEQQQWIDQLGEASEWREKELRERQQWISQLEETKAWQEQTIREQQQWISQLEETKAWQEQTIREQQQWISQLEETNAWHEQQFQEHQRWVAQLEEAKAWHQEQSKRWEEAASKPSRRR